MLDLDFKLAIEKFDLEVKLKIEQKIVGIFGASGAGKSSFFNVLSGLKNPKFGKIEIDRKVIFDSQNKINLPPHERKIGYVFQDSQLFPHLSVKNNLLYGYKLLEENERKFELEQVVALLELENLLSRKPLKLSGGEKQRVALGRALLSSPSLLLLDEPLASLDESLKRQILPFLKRVQKETEIPMLYVSHSINEILELTEWLIVLEKGKVLDFGRFFEIVKKEKILTLAKSFGLENIFEVEFVEQQEEKGFTLVKLGEQNIKIPFLESKENGKVTISVRPEDIALALTEIKGISIQNQIEGEVTGISEIGHHGALVQVDVGETILVEVSLKTLNDFGLELGKKVFCLMKSQAFNVL
ncbi:MAG: molybdenum ABC transporter ATP-binding protein [Calditrichaeota bacterium]|nr:MAG: molybdenum ABC transporter ATP-binding protein [Calditrichota bacterium]